MPQGSEFDEPEQDAPPASLAAEIERTPLPAPGPVVTGDLKLPSEHVSETDSECDMPLNMSGPVTKPAEAQPRSVAEAKPAMAASEPLAQTAPKPQSRKQPNSGWQELPRLREKPATAPRKAQQQQLERARKEVGQCF